MLDETLSPSDVAQPHQTQVCIWEKETCATYHPEHPFRPGCGHFPDAVRAFDIHRARAEAAGQVWSARHAETFRELHQAYTLTARGFSRGRTAWPLAVGTGKTQSLVAFALAQAEVAARGGKPLSLLVCIERVEQGATLYHDMVAAGVPPELVGVYHRKTAKEVEAGKLVPSVTDPGKTLFLIATHAAMLRGEDFIATVNTYQGAGRSLAVWDESLVKSQGRHMDLETVDMAVGAFESASRYYGGPVRSDALDAVQFLKDCVTSLQGHFEQACAGGPIREASLPALSPDEDHRFQTAIREVLADPRDRKPERRAHRETIEAFLEHAQRPLRVVPYEGQGRRVGVVHYLTRIPESLSRLIVLDASHTIRRLTGRHDSTLRETTVDCRVKRFDAVSVRHLVQGAGRDRLEQDLTRDDSATTQGIVKTLSSYPQDEGVIVVTFKPAGGGPRKGARGRGKAESDADLIKQHMRAAGIDPDRQLENGKPGFVFLTWGQHVGVSHYAYCRHVLCVGVLRRNALDIASSIVGQRADLLTPVAADPAEVGQTVLSEMFHHVIQAAGRGACRNTVNGAAEPMTLTLLCSEVFPADWWEQAMPGVVVTLERPGAKARATAQSAKVATLAAVLEGLPAGVSEVSSRTLKAQAGMGDMRPDAYSRLLACLDVHGWRRDGRTFRRCPFDTAA